MALQAIQSSQSILSVSLRYWWTERITFFKAGLLYCSLYIIEDGAQKGGETAGHTPGRCDKKRAAQAVAAIWYIVYYCAVLFKAELWYTL